MTFDEYQKKALTTVHKAYDDERMQQSIWVMGLAGESGEIIEKWKKILHYKKGELTKEETAEMGKEIGDIVWYAAVFAHSLGLSFDGIMQKNVEKLQSRKKRGVITGQGDNR